VGEWWVVWWVVSGGVVVPNVWWCPTYLLPDRPVVKVRVKARRSGFGASGEESLRQRVLMLVVLVLVLAVAVVVLVVVMLAAAAAVVAVVVVMAVATHLVANVRHGDGTALAVKLRRVAAFVVLRFLEVRQALVARPLLQVVIRRPVGHAWRWWCVVMVVRGVDRAW